MERRFGALVWSAFVRVYGPYASVGGVLVTLIVWNSSPNASIQLKWLVPAGIVWLIVVATFASAAHAAFRERGKSLPKVLTAVAMGGQAQRTILLLEASELFSYNIPVSIYHVSQGGFEQLIGLGVVSNIQQDGKIQVTVVRTMDGTAEIYGRLEHRDADVLKLILVKPSVPYEAIRLASTEEEEEEDA